LKHVVLDGRILLPRMTGAGRYVVELARRLPAFADDLTIHVLLRPSVRTTLIPMMLADAGVELHYLDVAIASARQWVAIPWFLSRLHPHLYHYPFADLPYVPCPAVVTVYDLNHILHPQYFSSFRLLKQIAGRMLTASTLRRVSAAFAISEETRRLITSQYPAWSSKIRTIPLGVDVEDWQDKTTNSEVGEDATFRTPLWGSRSYFLYVGVDRPHKNLQRLVRSFARFRRAHGWEGSTGPYLWLAGVGKGSPQLQCEILAMSLERDVRLNGVLSDAHLRKAYGNAIAMAYVSTSEGFGLPILEAFAAGVAVVTANTSSMPEVGGDAVLYVDPEDEVGISEALSRVWTDEGLRKRLIIRGRERSAQFSWESTARATAEAYHDVLRLATATR